MPATKEYEWIDWLVPRGYKERLHQAGVETFLKDLCERTQAVEWNNGGTPPGEVALSGLFYDAHQRVAQGEPPHQVAAVLSLTLFRTHWMLAQTQRTLQAVQEQLRLDVEKRQGLTGLLTETAAGEPSELEVSAREQELEQERDRWYERATQAKARIEELENELEKTKQARRRCEDEKVHLETEVATRNRIIVEQQENLNELSDPA
jgi:hypothetical protein